MKKNYNRLIWIFLFLAISLLTLIGIKYKPFKESYLFEYFHWIHSDTLKLIQQNDKCGEWGGDIETISIYHKSQKLYGFYKKETYNCDTLAIVGRKSPEIFKSNEVELTNKEIRLLKKSINSLTDHKIRNRQVVDHAGIANTVQLIGKDEEIELFISDYSSFKWKKFHQLKKQLLK